MCKVWKTYIHIIHGVNTGKIRNAHRLYTAKPKVIHKVIHRLWIMLITVTRYRVESTKIELVFVRVRRTVWIISTRKARAAADRKTALERHFSRKKLRKLLILGLTKWGFMNIIEMMFSVIHVVKYCLAGSY